MTRLLLIVMTLLGTAQAQFVGTPTSVTVRESPAVTLQVAGRVLAQPARPEVRVGTGQTTALLTFSLLSEVASEVRLSFSDPRLVMRGGGPATVRLSAHSPQSVSLLALEAHSGVVSVSNTEGQVIAQVPYVVAPPRTLNQSLSLNYSPLAGQGTLSYSVSGVPQSVLDPRWNLNVNLNLSGSGGVGGSVSVGVNW